MKPEASLISRLDAAPVMGVSLAAVRLLRLDLCGGNAPGNKWFKLQQNIAEARKCGINTVLSFIMIKSAWVVESYGEKHYDRSSFYI